MNLSIDRQISQWHLREVKPNQTRLWLEVGLLIQFPTLIAVTQSAPVIIT